MTEAAFVTDEQLAAFERVIRAARAPPSYIRKANKRIQNRHLPPFKKGGILVMSVSSIDTLWHAGDDHRHGQGAFKEERAKKRLDGWFLAREIAYQKAKDSASLPAELRAAEELKAILENLPLSISRHAVFAGTQSDAFARSYALINPAFEVETFSGYCDPTAVYGDIVPDETLTRERIDAVCEAAKQSDYVKALAGVYDEYAAYTGEVAFFIEQVTGHLIPDFRPVLAHGVQPILEELDRRIAAEPREKKRINYTAMKITLEALLTLAGRYADIAAAQKAEASPERAAQLDRLESTLRKVPARGAENLYEAIQSFLLLWEVMCLEQAPNPFAFSVGNADPDLRALPPHGRHQAAKRPPPCSSISSPSSTSATGAGPSPRTSSSAGGTTRGGI